MTLTPTWLPVTGVEGKAAPRNDRCAVPGCGEASAHGHHIYPRSHLRSQPMEWVLLPDDRIVSNVIGLCFPHHSWVTGEVGHGHRARLDWNVLLEVPLLYWIRLPALVDPDWVGPLDPQPLGGGTPPTSDTPHGPAADGEIPSHRLLNPGETCEECGYTRPLKRPPGPKRRALSWGVTVPQDAELGAEVLDDWVEQFAAVLGLEGTKGLVRYHVLATVLAWAGQNMGEFIRDVKEAGEA